MAWHNYALELIKRLRACLKWHLRRFGFNALKLTLNKQHLMNWQQLFDAAHLLIYRN